MDEASGVFRLHAMRGSGSIRSGVARTFRKLRDGDMARGAVIACEESLALLRRARRPSVNLDAL